jgi:hypothetical protein
MRQTGALMPYNPSEGAMLSYRRCTAPGGVLISSVIA